MEPVRNVSFGNQMPFLTPSKKEPSEGQQAGSALTTNLASQDTVAFGTSPTSPPDAKKVEAIDQYQKIGKTTAKKPAEAPQAQPEPEEKATLLQPLPENQPESELGQLYNTLQAQKTITNLALRPDAALQTALSVYA